MYLWTRGWQAPLTEDGQVYQLPRTHDRLNDELPSILSDFIGTADEVQIVFTPPQRPNSAEKVLTDAYDVLITKSHSHQKDQTVAVMDSLARFFNSTNKERSCSSRTLHENVTCVLRATRVRTARWRRVCTLALSCHKVTGVDVDT